MENKDANKIDFVMIWVNGDDPEWQKERNKYAGKNPEDIAVNRFRDWGILKYWFRGVEKFAPWVNNIYFITCGHYPDWLNLNHPKLKFVKHEDYIPKEYLPTFSSNPIEINLNRIKELEEKFVFFNDDMAIVKPISKEDFFVDGKPRYVAGLNIIRANDGSFSYILLNDMQMILKDKDKKDFINKNNITKWLNLKYGLKTNLKTLLLMPFNFFSVLINTHSAAPILKSTMDYLWKNDYEILDKTSKNKFRSKEDVNQYIFSFYNILNNNFIPSDLKTGYFTTDNDYNYIKKKSKNSKIICINDVDENVDYEKEKSEIIKYFEEILPEKSKFEK